VAALTLDPLLDPLKCVSESFLPSDVDSSDPRLCSGGGSDWRFERWCRRRDESRRPQKRAISALKSGPPLAEPLLLLFEALLVESMVDSRRFRIFVEAEVDDESVDLPHGRLFARSARVSRRGNSLVLRLRVDPDPKSLFPKPTPTPLPHSRRMSVSCARDDLKDNK
jgi:hypothetical protein